MIKKILLTLAALLVAGIALLLILVSRQPDHFSVSRSTVIAAPPQRVFDQVNDFHNWNAWSPWAKIDPNCKFEFNGAESGKGAIFAWAGNQEVGEGRQEIVESKPPELVRIKLDFIKPFAASSNTEFVFQPEGASTRVIWTMSGENDFIGKCISLVMDCETMIGPQFEQGLANMKSVAESAPQP